jgi:uncharacterized membrane protein
LQKHPDYYSLLAFSDVLNNFRVPNSAYQLSFDQLEKLPLPFVCHLANKNYAVVTEFDDKHVKLSHNDWNNKVLKIDEFKKNYGGSVLVAEKEAASGEADFGLKRRKEVLNNWLIPISWIRLTIDLVATLLLNSSFFSHLNLQIGSLTIFKTIGLITSILLLLQSIDTNNPLISKFCGGDGNQDCNAILSSKSAKIAGITWSEIGFSYFAGTWLVLLFYSSHLALLQTLAILNLGGIIYSFYSIYYQWQIARQWCRFCCIVQAIFWLEFFSFLPVFEGHNLQFPVLTEWCNFVMTMAIPIMIWLLIRPLLLKAKQLRPLKQQLYKLKYNKELFDKMLSDEIKYTLPADENSIIIGNKTQKT